MKAFFLTKLLPTLALLMALHGLALAQTSPPSGGVEPTSVPIDGGATLLLAGGVAYGLRKLRRRRA